MVMLNATMPRFFNNGTVGMLLDNEYLKMLTNAVVGNQAKAAFKPGARLGSNAKNEGTIRNIITGVDHKVMCLGELIKTPKARPNPMLNKTQQMKARIARPQKVTYTQFKAKNKIPPISI